MPDAPTRMAIHRELIPVVRQWLVLPWSLHILCFFSLEFAGAVLIPHILYGPWRNRNPTVDYIVVPSIALALMFVYIGVEWWINARNRQIDEQVRNVCQRNLTSAPTLQVEFGFLEPYVNRKWHATYLSDIGTRVVALRGNNANHHGTVLRRPTGHIPFWIKMFEPVSTILGCIVGFGAGLVLLDDAGPL